MARGRENEKVISKYEKLQGQGTFSKAIDAVNPEVSIATTSGSGLPMGSMCFEGTCVLFNIQYLLT